MARIVVAGYVVRYPLGGNVWAHLQYVLGLARLGHEVWFVEEAGWEDSCYDPDRDVMTSNPAYGLRVLAELMERFGLAGRWAYRDSAGRWHGLSGDAVDELIAGADLFLDLGGTCSFPQMGRARRRAYVDMDPAFTQFRAFGAHWRLDAYDVLFTYGANIGRGTCPVPTLGFDWRPLRPPVLLDVWQAPDRAPAGAPWTTVAHWLAYGACEYGGETYGQKDVEFMRFIDLPGRAAPALEVAVAGEGVPTGLLEASGWRLVDPLAVSRDPWRYRAYIWASRGEFSVAKNAYVKTGCGWFSDRTASYLAAGRPAVVQDTGVSNDLPAGRGLLVFRTPEEAAAALASVEADYETHARAAREIAWRYFDASEVLAGLLADCGV